MGHGEIGIFSLEQLLSQGARVTGVFTRSCDRSIVRDSPSLFTRASNLGLNVYTFKYPSNKAFLEDVKRTKPDYVISVQYDRILKKELIELPKKGVLNLHFSPLPRLRGCFPTKWAIINNESSGVTLHYINEGIDTGDIVAQEIVELENEETDCTLYNKLIDRGKHLMKEYAKYIVNSTLPKARTQDESCSSYHPRQLPYNGMIDWTKPARWVERYIRAFTFPPHSAAKTYLEGKQELQIRAPTKVVDTTKPMLPGSIRIANSSEALIACGNGAISVSRIIINGEVEDVTILKGLSTNRLFVGDAVR